MKIANSSGEKLDVLIEDKKDADITLMLAHGFGADKHESFHLFDDFSKALSPHFRILRFDFSGYGQSEGKQEEVDYQKHAQDLKAVLNYVQKTYPGQIYLYAHSMGCFVTALLNPSGIQKTIFGAPPSIATDTINIVKNRILAKKGEYNPQGISIYPRSSGSSQKIGPTFWSVLKDFDAPKLIDNFAKNTNLLVLKPMQDDVTGNDNYDYYQKISGLTYQPINGNHSFTKPEDRKVFFKKIKEFLLTSS